MYTPAFVGLAVSGASDWVYSSSLLLIVWRNMVLNLNFLGSLLCS